MDLPDLGAGADNVPDRAEGAPEKDAISVCCGIFYAPSVVDLSALDRVRCRPAAEGESDLPAAPACVSNYP